MGKWEEGSGTIQSLRSHLDATKNCVDLGVVSASTLIGPEKVGHMSSKPEELD